MGAKHSQSGGVSRRVLYAQYAASGGYPPLLHSARMLVRSGWEVRCLAVGAYGTERLRLEGDAGIQVTELQYCPPGWWQKLHYLAFCFRTILMTCVWRPSWLYASDLLACPAALVASYLPPLRVIYHEHDSPNGSERSILLRACLWTRRQLARRAELCILPNQRRAEVFAHTTGRRQAAVVWNCPLRSDVPAAPLAPHGASSDGLLLYFHGSVNPVRLPEATLTALANTPRCVRLRVVGYETIGHTGYVARLQEVTRELGISDRVEFLGAVPRERLFGLASECHVGLAFMPTASNDVNHRHMAGASNKPFEYLACGLALLVSDLPDWRECYVEPGYGRACDPQNPRSVAEALRWFLAHQGETRAMGQRGRERILAEWNYEREFAAVMQRMNDGARP
ncbi:MAG: glycosyltransferase [Deltaproteobacteria bacterium]|nr:glycosyltransferase [Deltaproteobacteria bacterium]